MNIYVLDTGCVNKKSLNFTTYDNVLWGDDNGHGSMCNYIINLVSDTSKIINYKILNKDKQGTTLQMVEALRHIYIYQEPGLINLSLSTPANYYREELVEICHEINNSGFTIVSSATNDHKFEYLSNIEGVYAIDSHDLGNRECFKFSDLKKRRIIGNRRPVLVKNNQYIYTFFGGNSKATAVFTGYFINYLKKYQNKGKSGNIFGEMDVLHQDNAFNTNSVHYKEIRKNIIEILKCEYKMNEEIYNKKDIMFYLEDINNFIIKLERTFGLSFEGKLIYINDFDTVENLSNLIGRLLIR